MKNLETKIVGGNLVFNGKVDYSDFELGFGALTIMCEDREWMVDVIDSHSNYDEIEDETKFELLFSNEIDKETFTECKFDLTDDDFFIIDSKAILNIGKFDEFKCGSLFLKIGHMAKVMNLYID